MNEFLSLPVALPTNAVGPEDVLLSVFTAAVMRAPSRYRVTLSDSWPVSVTELKGPMLDDGLTFRGYGTSRALITSPDGTLRLFDLWRGYLRVTVSGADVEAVDAAFQSLRKAYPHIHPEEGPTIPMVFWALGENGPISFRRDVAVPSWQSVRPNYPERVRELLDPLMPWQVPAAGGQLLLWYGVPGTGKTWAIRALASEWREWCQFEYITDPDKLFARAAYLTQVLLDDVKEDDGVPRWRCLILEDTGELLAADAKAHQGQALSRLLNVVDGLLGQGLRILLLITTNEELKTLHPAVTRPGRCLYQVIFHSFPVMEAAAWMGARANGCGDAFSRPATLAELYQHAEQFPVHRSSASRMGF